MAGRPPKDVEEEEEEEEEEDEEEEDEEEEDEEDEPAKAAAGQSVASRKAEEEDEFDFQKQAQPVARQPQPVVQPRPAPVPSYPVNQPQAAAQPGKARKLANDTHDEALDVDEEEEVVTPKKAQQQMFRQEFTSKQLQNDAHDEAFDVGDDGHHVSTPPAKAGPRAGGPGAPIASGAKLANNQHDEAFDVGDEEDVSSDEEATKANARQVNAAPQQAYGAAMQRQVQQPINWQPQQQQQQQQQQHAQEEDESSSDEEDSLRASAAPQQASKDYNPVEFQGLNVSKEVKELFQFITQYKPHNIDLETKVKPFIPDYIPAVGDIDTFIKIPRPDNKPDNLGLTVLDEPASVQSNPSVVKIGLSYGSKKKAPSVYVETIEDARNRPTLIDKWMTDISNLHKKKPAPTVNYTKNQPDVENLLQVWPSDFEDLLSHAITLPPAKLDVELYQYVKVICCMLDIPVYSNLIESLHVLFTLYTEFKANQHFQNGPEMNND